MFKARTVLPIVFLLAPQIFAASESESAIATIDDRMAKVWKYSDKFGSGRDYFYDEDGDFQESRDGVTTVSRHDNVKTREEALARAEKNKEAFEDLHRWRFSYDDFFVKNFGRRISPIADIEAKRALLDELFSKRVKELAPDVAIEQSDMGLELVSDIFLECESGDPEKRYGCFLKFSVRDLSRTDKIYEMAEFLYARQIYLRRMWVRLLPIIRDELFYLYGDDWRRMYNRLSEISHRCLSRGYTYVRAGGVIYFSGVYSVITSEPVPEKIRDKIPDALNEIDNYTRELEKECVELEHKQLPYLYNNGCGVGSGK